MSFDRQKLIRVLGMTGSTFDGEALVALRRGQEMLKAAGLSWEELLAPGGGTRTDAGTYRQLRDENHRLLDEILRLQAQLRRAQNSGRLDLSGWIEPRTTAEKLECCTQLKRHLTEWEVEFVIDIAGWRGALTPRQSATLDKIVGKLRHVVRLRGRAA